jgi:hypothetical protein
MNRFFGALWLVGAGCAVVAVACAPSSSVIGKMSDPDAGVADGGAMPDGPVPSGVGGSAVGGSAVGGSAVGGNGAGGSNAGGSGAGGVYAAACNPGEMIPAADGCNSCICNHSGRWACTELDCPCKSGETRVSDDQCITCTCGMDGTWECPSAETGCATACDEGATKPVGDGCNTCMCFHDNWACTLLACSGPSACEPGLGDCDGISGNGCETKLTADPLNCGGCGIACDLAGGASCESGECALTGCSPGLADCNLDPSDGCEKMVGNQGCNGRCDYPAGSSRPVPATGDCTCPAGMTCVKNAPGKPDYCYPTPNGCGTQHTPDCGCLGSCVCTSNSGRTCSQQMSGGGFILDCDGLN